MEWINVKMLKTVFLRVFLQYKTSLTVLCCESVQESVNNVRIELDLNAHSRREFRV